MTITSETAVERLTRPWHDVLSPEETGLDRYLPVEYPPLLDMLDEACRTSVSEAGAGSGGDPSTRSLLNLEAYMLRNRIDGSVKTWIAHLSKGRADRDLKASVAQLAGLLKAHHASRTITDAEHARIGGFFVRWCEQVWKLFDPPVIKELRGACPNPDCEAETFADGDGSSGAALVAFYMRNTNDVRAKCRVCGWEWETPSELRLLGEHLGATQDVEFLRAAGL